MIRSLLKRRREARWARDFEAGYRHGAAWLLRGGSIEELLGQKGVLFCEFDRGINCAVADYRFVTDLGVPASVVSIALAA